jgi:hypothetical protein
MITSAGEKPFPAGSLLRVGFWRIRDYAKVERAVVVPTEVHIHRVNI